MKPFQKFIFLSVTPIFFTGVISYLTAGSFADFLPKTIFFTVGFSAIISLIYVFIFEKLQAKGNSILKNMIMSNLSIFLSIFLFGLVWQAIFFDEFTLLTPTYQGLFGVIVFFLIIGLVSIYRYRNSKNILHFKEKPQNYAAIVLCIGFIHTLFIASFYIELLSFTEFLRTFIENYLKVLISVSVIMSFLFVFSKIKLTKNNIYVTIILTSVIAHLAIHLIDFQKYQLQIFIIRLFTVGFPTTIILVAIIIYRNNKNEALQKISKLTHLISTRNAEYFQLKNQVNPHFLFNNLNTMISFIEVDPKKAIEFGHHLSNVYRHYLKNDTEDFVSLSDELHFISEYLEIYALKAFENNAIDYLLKPIDERKLDKMILKFSTLKLNSDFDEKKFQELNYFKNSFLITAGNSLKKIDVNEISGFFSEENATFLVTNQGRVFTTNYSLEKLEQEINPDIFFRISRKFLVNKHFINEIHRKNQPSISVQNFEGNLKVSRLRLRSFLQWYEK